MVKMEKVCKSFGPCRYLRILTSKFQKAKWFALLGQVVLEKYVLRCLNHLERITAEGFI